jgi:ferredoxin-type protein NapG
MTGPAGNDREVAMERRDFFKLGARNAAHVTYKLASARAANRARNWIRPPFALAELDFLLACTRCDQCIEACPHDVLFALPARLGVQVAGTPAMDLLAKGCHMCDGWPCVGACEPNALAAAAPEAPLPKLASAGIVTENCLPYSGPECGACAHACPVPGALEWDGGGRPVINQDLCTGCALCREACIVEPKAVAIATLPPDDAPSAGP